MLAETLHFLQVIYVFTLSSLFPSSLREDVPASCLTQQSPICHLCCSETSRQGRQWPFQFYSLQVQWASLSSCFSIPFYSKIPRVCWSALAPPSPSQLTFVRPKSPSAFLSTLMGYHTLLPSTGAIPASSSASDMPNSFCWQNLHTFPGPPWPTSFPQASAHWPYFILGHTTQLVES